MTLGEESQDSRWYVVQTKPKQESRAAANLRHYGLETLAPVLWEPRAPRRRHEPAHEETPLFPGYVFARFDAATLLAKVRYTRGVHKVIGFGEYATPVDDAVIALIQNRIREDGFVHVADPQPGDMIRIVEGPLRSLEGVFERRMRGCDRVVILLTTLGSQMRVQLHEAFVRSTHPHVA